MTKTSRRLVLVIAAGVAVFAAFSIYADVSELGQRIAGFPWWVFAAALGLALVNYALRFARWQLYLKAAAVEVPARTSGLIFVSGFALSITPGKLGELIKSYLLREAHGIPIARTAPIVVAERVTDLGALLILGLIGVAAYGVARQTVLAGAAVLAVGLAVLSTPSAMRATIRVVTATRFTARWREPLLELAAGLRRLVRPGALSWATGVAVVAWLAECVGFALIAGAFPGADVPLGLAVLIYASTTIAGALSFLPGGLLVTEATMTLFLVTASTGMDEPTAVAATILTRLATLWFAVALGLVAMAWLRRVAPKVGQTPDTLDLS